jgi:hypothetical protein
MLLLLPKEGRVATKADEEHVTSRETKAEVDIRFIVCMKVSKKCGE